jgi:transcription antitermination factor NusA-like protein
MKFPICSVCLKSDMLCNACAEKVGNEDIRMDEVKMFRRLNEILSDQKSLRDVEIKRAVGKKIIVIVTDKNGMAKLIGKGGRIVKKLAKELERPVRIVEYVPDLSDFIREVLFNVSILGINVLYKPEKKIYKIRVSKSERTKLPISSEILASISRSLFHADVDVVFE